MAEQNYLAAENAARRQARMRTRGRIDQMIDPLESAATMDRLQGANVSGDLGTGAAEYDPGSFPIVRMAASAGGGGRSPFRTAQMSTDDGEADAPAVTTVAGGRFLGRMLGGGPTVVQGGFAPDSPCAGGNCPVPQGGRVISSGPVQMGTVVGEPVIEGGIVQESMPSYASPHPNYQAAVDARNVDPATAAVLQAAGNAATDESRFQQTLDFQKSMASRQQWLDMLGFVMDSADQDIRRNTAEAAAEHERAMAAYVRAGTPADRARTRQELLNQVHYNGMSPESFVEAEVAAASRLPPVSNKEGRPVGGVQPVSDAQLEETKRNARREAYGGKFFAQFIRHSRTLRADANTPGAFTDTDAGARAAVASLVSAYTNAGLFPQRGEQGKPWSRVAEALDNDLYNVLTTGIPALYEKEAEDEIALLPKEKQPAARDAARQRGLDTALNIFGVTKESMRTFYMASLRGEFDPSNPFAKPKKQEVPPPAVPEAKKDSSLKLPSWMQQSPEAWGSGADTSTMPQFLDPNDTMPPVPGAARANRMARSV